MSSSIRLGAIFWLLTAEFFLAQIIAQTALPGFSLATQDISLLGVTACGADASASGYACSPLHLVFNAGIFINGMLVVVGLWLTRTMWPQGRLTTAALWLLALGGDGSMLVGLFPLDQNLGLHMFGAALALGVACLGFLVLARVLWPTHRSLAIYTVATGSITLLAFLLYVAGVDFGLGKGTLERIAAWPHTIWYMTMGVLILLGRLKSTQPV